MHGLTLKLTVIRRSCKPSINPTSPDPNDGGLALQRSALPKHRGVSPKHAELRGPSAKPNGSTIIVADILLLVQNVGQGLGSKVLDRDALRSAIEGAKDIPGLQGIWNCSPPDGNSFAAGTWCNEQQG